ncbi:MAG: GntR family transcriptional regulator, partial [Pseudomonas sp.]
MAYGQVRQRRLSDDIVSQLESMILEGTLKAGERLPAERALAEQFGVSRPSLREALRILEAEGLITVVRGVLGGVVVRAPDVRVTARTAAVLLQSRNVTLGDVHDARSVIEPAA